MKLYQARLQTMTVAVMAHDLEDAKLCLQETYPNQTILSLIIAPEWFETPEDQL
jgi:hypothetical protein